jgi:hypothetical protein
MQMKAQLQAGAFSLWGHRVTGVPTATLRGES